MTLAQCTFEYADWRRRQIDVPYPLLRTINVPDWPSMEDHPEELPGVMIARTFEIKWTMDGTGRKFPRYVEVVDGAQRDS